MSERSPAPWVEARDLTLTRGATRVLERMSLRIEPGEFVALVGPSGCGKSSLLAVLAGLLVADSGDVLIDGAPEPRRLGRLTLLPQSDALMPWRTALDNVRLGPRLAGVGGSESTARARATLARFGLTGFEDHYPHALSGGMRQRVALARTLLSGSRMWLLDEPFGALDALTRLELRGVLAQTWARERPTALLVTHDIDEALVLADRVLVCAPRPARIVREIAVPRGDRPDGAESAIPEHAALRAQVLEALRRAGVPA